MVFNFDKRSQQCDMINSPGNSETNRPNFMTGPQMCGIMTGDSSCLNQTVNLNIHSEDLNNGLVWVLCILTSEHGLRSPFAGQNKLFGILTSFSIQSCTCVK